MILPVIQTKQRSSYTGVVGGISSKLASIKYPTQPPVDWTAAKLPFYTTSYRELFEEVMEQGPEDTREQWNAFEHYALKCEFPPFVSKMRTYRYESTKGHSFTYNDPRRCWRSVNWGTLDNPTKGLPVLYEKVIATGHFVRLVDSIDTLVSTAVRQMLGEIRPDLSLINSLYELKDFKTLPRQCETLLQTLRMLSKEMPRLVINSKLILSRGKRTLIRILKTVADALLQQEFNIKPLMSDIEAVRDTIQTYRRAILRRMADDGVLRRRDFNVSLANLFPESVLTVREPNPYAAMNNTWRWPDGLAHNADQTRVVRYPVTRFHAQVEYSHYYLEYQRENALLLGVLDRLGVMFDPRIVWNAIPWSFAVDWVLSVNRWLSQFKQANLAPVTVVHRFCWSQHIRRQITCSMRVGADDTVVPGITGIASSVTEDSYLRSTSGLNIVAALAGSGVNPKEFILSSALAVSRLGR